MANKVEIIVVAKDMTGAVFDDVKRKAKAAGEDAGKEAGDGIQKGVEDSLKDATIGDLSGPFGEAGRNAGESFSAGFEDTLGGGDFESLGSDAGTSFSDGFDQTLSDGGTRWRGTATAVGEDVGRAIKEGLDAGLDDGGGSDGSGLLSRIKDMAAGALEVGRSLGTSVTEGMADGIVAGAGPLVTAVGAVLAGAILGAAPIVLAAIGGLFSAAAVTAVVAGALVVAFQDPQIKDAAKGLGKTMLDALKEDAGALKEPILTAVDEMGAKFDELQPRLRNIFSGVADYIGPLEDAIEKIADSLTNAFSDAVEGDLPVFQALLDGIVGLVDEISEGISELSDDGAEAATSLALGFDLLKVAVEGTFEILEAMVNVVSALAESGILGPGAQAEWERYNAALEQGSEGLNAVHDSAQAAHEELDAVKDALLAQVDPAYNFWKATTDVATAQERLTKAQAKYGEDSPQANEAAAALAKKYIELADASGEVALTSDGKLTPALRRQLELFGASPAAIDAIEQSLRNASETAEGFAKPREMKVTLVNAGATVQGLAAIKGAVDAIPSSKTITINTISAGGYAGKASGGNIGAAATGGVRGNMVLVGESGPEIVKLPVGSTVFPNGQSRRMLGDQQYEEAAQWQKLQGGGGMDSDAIVSELREMRKAFMAMKLYVNERAIGGLQGYEADILGRAG